VIALIRHLMTTYRAFVADDGPAFAGYISFATLLGLFPFVILATNIAALAVGRDRGESIVDELIDYLPPHVVQTLEPVILDVLDHAGTGVLTFSGLAFDRAYGTGREHGVIRGRLIALSTVLLGVLVMVSLGLIVIFAPIALGTIDNMVDVDLPPSLAWITSGWANVLRYGIGLSVFLMFLLYLHRVLPAHRLNWEQLVPGVLLSTAIWVIAVLAYTAFIAWRSTYASTYGTLAGVVITLMFFYITGMAIIFGAVFNAVLNGRKEG